ncbi:MAG: glycosyltransferase family 9 protein [Candidatus Poribacteria bacterium]
MFRDLFYNYIPDLLSNLYFRYGVRLMHAAEEDVDAGDMKTVCVLANSGFTDIMPLMSMLKALRYAIDGLKLLVVVDSEDTKNFLEKSSIADKIFVLNDTVKKNKALRQIRNEWIDLTIAATHPSYANAKTAFQTGAIYSIGFRYDYRTHEDTDFFFTHPIPFDPQKSEMERYLDLIRPLGLYRLL